MVEERATVFPGVPTMFALMAEMKNIGEFDFSRIRMTTNTAAALHQKHIDALARVFPKAQIFSMYGLTECKRCTYLPPAEIGQKPGSVGIAIPGTEVWIVDDQGQRVDAGVEGELVVRGPTVMKGYWEKPEATRERLKPGPLPGEFILHTGDYCKQDEDGYVYFAGRRDDMIKSRGEKVAPKEVENALVAIEGVKETAVIGVADDVLGSAIKAFVVLEAGVELNERQLQIECRQATRELHGAQVHRDHHRLAQDDNRQDQEDGSEVSDLQEQIRASLEQAQNANQYDGDVAIVDAAAEAATICEIARRSEEDPGERALAFAARRAKGELLGHVLGVVEFLGIELLCAADCVVPRKETEIAGRAALAALKDLPGESLRVVDMCCGAGNLACAIATQEPRARVVASDLTGGCVKLTRQNVTHLGLEERVQVVQGDLFEPVREVAGAERFDLIVCNPPYISTGRLEEERAELLENEPREAFDGGPYGLSIHQRVLKDATSLLRPGGWLMFEFGVGRTGS